MSSACAHPWTLVLRPGPDVKPTALDEPPGPDETEELGARPEQFGTEEPDARPEQDATAAPVVILREHSCRHAQDCSVRQKVPGETLALDAFQAVGGRAQSGHRA